MRSTRPHLVPSGAIARYLLYFCIHLKIITLGIISNIVLRALQRRFATEQVHNCYPSFTAQFDQLHYDEVIWQPYNRLGYRYPEGISQQCFSDSSYWFTKAKIIYDICVEEMSQQRVMRQFALRQLPDPPASDAPLDARIHK